MCSPVSSGVLKGSVLGFFLLLILINDIDLDFLYSTAPSFADDTRIPRQVKTPEDVALLHEDLNAVFTWTAKTICYSTKVNSRLSDMAQTSLLK